MPIFQIDSLKPYNQLNSAELEKLSQVQNICDLLLKTVDRICRKYNIKYFLAYGNLIGAVRHGGMIPWDDDVDIWMFPSEYDKFKQHTDELDETLRLVDPEEYAPYYVDNVPRLVYLPSHYHDDPERAEKLKGLMEHIHLDIFLLTRLPESWFMRQFFRKKLILLYALCNAHRYHIPYENYSFFQKIAGFIFSLAGKCFSSSFLIKTINRMTRKYENRENLSKIIVYNDALFIILKNFEFADVSSTVDMPYGDMVAMVPVGYDRILKNCYSTLYMELPPEEERIAHMTDLSTITIDK